MDFKSGHIKAFDNRADALREGYGVPLSAAELASLSGVEPHERPGLLRSMGRKFDDQTPRPTERHRFKSRPRVSR